MWLFTKIGFFSVVSCLADDDKTPDDMRVCVRARSRRHLEKLKAKFSSLDSSEIMESKETDYRYRIIVQKDTWARIVSKLTEHIDYTNFKGAVEETGDKKYSRALADVWQIMWILQMKATKFFRA